MSLFKFKDLVFSIFARDETSSGFGSVHDRIRRLDNSMAGVGERMDRAGRKMRNFGVQASAAAVPVGLALRSISQSSGDFEEAMLRIGSLPGFGQHVDELSSLGEQIADTARMTAVEAASAIEMLGRNSLDAASILDGALISSMELAAIGNIDMARSADIVTDTMAAFGKEAKELPAVVDQITGTILSSKFNMDDYRLALAQGAGVFGEFGGTLEDFNAGLATTAHLFSGGSDAGTAFKTFVTRLKPDSLEAHAVIRDLGLEFFDLQGRMKSMPELAGELQRAFSGLTEEMKIAASKEIFGVDAVRVALGLAGAGQEGVLKKMGEIGQADAGAIFAERMKGFNASMDRTAALAGNLGIAIGDSGLLGDLTKLADGVGSAFRWFSQLNPVVLRTGAWIGIVVAVAAPLVLSLGLLAGAVSLVGAKFALLITGVVAIGAALLTFGEHLGITGSALTAIAGVVLLVFNPFTKLRLAVTGLGFVFKRVMPASLGYIKRLAAGAKTFLVEKMGAVIKTLGDKLNWLGTQFWRLFDRVVGNSYVPDMVDGIADEFSRLGDEMTGVAEFETDRTASLFERMAGGALGSIKGMAREGSFTFAGLFDGVLAAGLSFADDMLDSVWKRVADDMSQTLTAGGGGGGLFGGLLGGLGSALFSSLPGFHNGTSFTVGGRSGIDRNLVAFRADRGERVTVTPQGQQGAPAVNLNMTINSNDADGWRRSRGQILRDVSLAVAAGSRMA